MPDTSAPLDTFRRELIDVAKTPVPNWRFTDLDSPSNATADTSEWREVSLPDRFAGLPAGWYSATIRVPEKHFGWSVAGAPIVLKWAARSYAEVFVNGRPMGRRHGELGSVTLTESAVPGETFTVALRVGGRPGKDDGGAISAGTSGSLLGLLSAHLEFGPLDEARPKIHDLLEHIGVCEQLIGLTGQGDYVLDQAAEAIDRGAITSGNTAALVKSVEESHDALKGLDDLFKRYSISLTANAHIDMAWLWDREETKQVCYDTFRSVLDLMKEYPDFVFAHSQAQSYEWVEQLWPDMFEEIRQRVAEGRWEIVGGMWVEPDCNLPNGESFVRQVLYGKRYFQQKFGVDVTLGWNPDSFGYNWAMPQVYRKCGIDSFLTQKLTWNDTNEWPHRAFWWESADGSRIFSYFPTGYVGFVESNGLIADLVTFSKSTGYERTDHLYGLGDHGGGPSREMLDRADRLSGLSPYPRVKHQKARDFINDLIAEIGPDRKVPVWDSELYLEYHRGTFTSQAKIKKGNRDAERLLRRLETFNVLAGMKGHAYPAAPTHELWKLTLFNQFHDILPGSCIAAAAEDAWSDYAQIQSEGGSLLDDALKAVVGEGGGIAVFNALNYPRGGAVSVPASVTGATPGAGVVVTAPDGSAVPSQWVREGDQDCLLFLAKPVPATGYAVYTLEPGAAETGGRELVATKDALENALVRVEIAPDGTFSRVFDKANDREVLATGQAGNVLQVFVDQPNKWEAWEIDSGFEADTTELRDPVEIEVLEAGPVRARVRTTRKWDASTFVQDITLVAGSPRIDVATRVDWQERQRMLKVLFPVSVRSDKATYEVPYSAIERSTGNVSSIEKAQFEVPALQWADLSADGYGVSLLNDCKHGHDIKGNRMRLTLLRSPISPDPNCDRGEQAFTYSLFPHAGDWRQGTYRAAFELNDPLFVRPASATGEGSLVEIGPENVLISAVKKAEDSDDVIVRFFETAGAGTAAHLRFAGTVESVWETDMMENNLHAVTFSGGVVEVPLGHNEVKTLKVRFQRP